MKKLSIALLLVVLSLSSATAMAQEATNTITLAWDPPTNYLDNTPLYPEEIKGYNAYHRPVETSSYPTGGLFTTNLTYTISNLVAGTYCFAATCISSANLESQKSPELRVRLPKVATMPPGGATGLRVIAINGKAP